MRPAVRERIVRIATLLAGLIAGLLLGLCALAVPAHAQKRVALVVGINAYPNLASDKQLHNAVNDARTMRDALQGLGFTVVYGEDLTRHLLTEKLYEFTRQLGRDDTAFVFFAGHGVSFSGANYLLPSDIPAPSGAGAAEEGRLANRALAEAEIVRQIEAVGARLLVLVLDACRDNPLQIAGRTLGNSRGLQRVEFQTRGLMSIYSVFTRVFVEKLKIPGLDLRAVTVQTRREVHRIAETVGHEQVVAYYDTLLHGEVYLAGRPPEPSRPGPPPVDPAAQAWAEARNTTSIAVLEDFVRQFGGTTYGPTARARLEELRRQVPTWVRTLPSEGLYKFHVVFVWSNGQKALVGTGSKNVTSGKLKLWTGSRAIDCEFQDSLPDRILFNPYHNVNTDGVKGTGKGKCNDGTEYEYNWTMDGDGGGSARGKDKSGSALAFYWSTTSFEKITRIYNDVRGDGRNREQ
jgi:hypothetical protein